MKATIDMHCKGSLARHILLGKTLLNTIELTEVYYKILQNEGFFVTLEESKKYKPGAWHHVIELEIIPSTPLT